MTNNQSGSNNTIIHKIIQYKHKPCIGRNCKNPGFHYLKILYLNKFAWFCDRCKKDLESYGLVLTNKPISRDFCEESRND
jgi:hypothetical protein